MKISRSNIVNNSFFNKCHSGEIYDHQKRRMQPTFFPQYAVFGIFACGSNTVLQHGSKMVVTYLGNRKE